MHAADEAAAVSWLVLGASGQVGYFLLQRLHERGGRVVAVTRHAAPRWAARWPNVEWLRGDLFADLPSLQARMVLSAGPLDGLAAWLERAAPPAPQHLIALSSTSVLSKSASPDLAERALVARLRLAEETVAAWSSRSGAAWTLLRPTLIYGCGLDRSLTPIAQRARRRGWAMLPRSASGLRQPVHAQDVADACLVAASSAVAAGHIYALPGGEVLAFGQMLTRVIDCVSPAPRRLTLPGPLLDLAIVAARGAARAGVPHAAALARLRDDLTFDASAAARDLAYRPRGFAPRAEMFEPPDPFVGAT